MPPVLIFLELMEVLASLLMPQALSAKYLSAPSLEAGCT